MTSKTMPIVQPTAVFFDLDETLIQHSQDISVLAADALRKIDPGHAHATLNFNVALKGAAESLWPRIHEYTGRGEQVLGRVLSNALAAIGSEPSLGPKMLKIITSDVAASTQLTPHAHETLQELKSMGIAVGIITNGFTFLQMHKVRAHGLMTLVDFVITSEDAGTHKPDRRIFDMALQKAGVHAATSWYVGDNYDKDIRGCTLAGMVGVLFDPDGGFDAGNKTAHPYTPHYIARNLCDILSMVNGTIAPK
jgi:putative hydrolase of the HAD superfamily